MIKQYNVACIHTLDDLHVFINSMYWFLPTANKRKPESYKKKTIGSVVMPKSTYSSWSALQVDNPWDKVNPDEFIRIKRPCGLHLCEDCAVPKNIHTSPTESQWKFQGGEGWQKLNWNLLTGGGGGDVDKNHPWRGMDIFWNHSFSVPLTHNQLQWS